MFLDIISNFLSLCPALSGKKINENFLSSNPGAVSIEAVASDPIYKSYTDGGALYQTCFKLVLREPFDFRNHFSHFYSDFSSWVEENNSKNTLPLLSGGFYPVSLSILKSGEVRSTSASCAEFEILCRFIYSK